MTEEKEKIEEQPQNIPAEEGDKETPEVKEDIETPTEDVKENTEELKKEDKEQFSEDVNYSEKEESEVADTLKSVGFNYESLCQEYAATGDISKETRAELAKVGITDVIVDNYIAGMKAKAEQDYNEIAKEVGGREKFNEIIQWAAHNCEPDELRYINSVTNKYGIASILRDLKERMEEKEGVNPEYQKGSGDKAAVEMFNSQAEMFDAIKNPKYKKDEYYRSIVQKKIAASREAGIDLGIDY